MLHISIDAEELGLNSLLIFEEQYIIQEMYLNIYIHAIVETLTFLVSCISKDVINLIFNIIIKNKLYDTTNLNVLSNYHLNNDFFISQRVFIYNANCQTAVYVLLCVAAHDFNHSLHTYYFASTQFIC